MIGSSELDMRSHIETETAHQTVVMLGASNLSRAFPTVISISQRVLAAPIKFYVAKGHGRSYGQVSSCFGKKISGIFSCGIWSAIQREKSVPITAFLTDIGNDLAYEVPVETVLQWVEGCLDRLSALNARVVVSDLPLDVLREVSPTQYRLFRAILFPRCSLEWPEMLARAQALSEGVLQLAKTRQIPLFAVRKQWYGLDPIHPRKKNYRQLWSELWSLAVDSPVQIEQARRSPIFSWYLRRLQPAEWSFLSFQRQAKQPTGHLSDGSTIALY